MLCCYWYFTALLLCRLTINWKFQIGGTAGEELSDTGFPIHPAGMHRSIKDASTLNVPIYITEWGIADGVDSRRHQLIGSYINAVSSFNNARSYHALHNKVLEHTSYTLLLMGYFAHSEEFRTLIGGVGSFNIHGEAAAYSFSSHRVALLLLFLLARRT